MKVTEITDQKITFDDGTTVEHYHHQNCCENVYADFEQLIDTTIWLEDFKKIIIKGVPDSGINLNGYFIPCYNRQNGYYSNSLSIIMCFPNGEKKIKDITKFVKDDIC